MPGRCRRTELCGGRRDDRDLDAKRRQMRSGDFAGAQSNVGRLLADSVEVSGRRGTRLSDGGTFSAQAIATGTRAGCSHHWQRMALGAVADGIGGAVGWCGSSSGSLCAHWLPLAPSLGPRPSVAKLSPMAAHFWQFFSCHTLSRHSLAYINPPCPPSQPTSLPPTPLLSPTTDAYKHHSTT